MIIAFFNVIFFSCDLGKFDIPQSFTGVLVVLNFAIKFNFIWQVKFNYLVD